MILKSKIIKIIYLILAKIKKEIVIIFHLKLIQNRNEKSKKKRKSKNNNGIQ